MMSITSFGDPWVETTLTIDLFVFFCWHLDEISRQDPSVWLEASL